MALDSASWYQNRDLTRMSVTVSGPCIRSLETMHAKHVGLQKRTICTSVFVTTAALNLAAEAEWFDLMIN